jgi:hypothetical protein
MQEIREKMTAMQKAAEGKILSILTDGQKKEFKEMKGKPVEISPEELRPSRGGQGGQRQGGQRPEGGQRPATRPAT